jgi:hypothetical protein
MLKVVGIPCLILRLCILCLVHYLSDLVVRTLVDNSLAINPIKLVVMPLDDQLACDPYIIDPVVMADYNECL